ncbi:hypothetical protein MOSE0_L03202 [Monosporozyma servazzii]
MYTHIDTNTEITESIDRQISSCHDDLVDVQSYLKVFKGYIQPNEKSIISFICGQQEMATETLVSLQNRKETIFVEVREFYENELAKNQKLDEQRCSTINELKVENQRLLEASKFYKAKAEKYQRHIKKSKKQHQQQLQGNEIKNQRLKAALHDLCKAQEAQEEYTKKIKDDLLKILMITIQEDKEKLLELEAQIDVATSSPLSAHSPPPAMHACTPLRCQTPSPSAFVDTTSTLRDNHFSPFPFDVDCSMIYRSPSPSSSAGRISSSRYTTVSSVSPTAPLRYNSTSPLSPYSEQDYESRDRCTPPPLPLFNLFTSSPLPAVFTPPPPPPPPPPIPYFLIQRPIQTTEASSCGTKDAHKLVDGLEDPYQQPTFEEELLLVRIAKLSKKKHDSECTPPKKHVVVKDTEFNEPNKWYLSPDISEIQTIEKPRKRNIALQLWAKLIK